MLIIQGEEELQEVIANPVVAQLITEQTPRIRM
jgi:hypothetical protein